MKHENTIQANSVVLPVAIGFAAGVTSASLCWLMWRKAFPKDNDDWIEPILSMSVEELKSRIGELPRRASKHWPWDKIRRTVFAPTDGEQEQGLSANAEPFQQTPLGKDEKTGLCIGSIFGMDVGGTLAKLVYFEQRPFDSDNNSATHSALHNQDLPSASSTAYSKRRSSASDIWDVLGSDDANKMFYGPPMKSGDTTRDAPQGGSSPSSQTTPVHSTKVPLSPRPIIDVTKSRDHAEALDRFYNFARRFDQYKTGVKEKSLSFYSRELGGEFHFIRFETREMDGAMDLIRMNNLHINICEMGATGGGAHKFSSVWERVLGIKMQKQGELDSLVAGMQFVLSSVVGECYSFRPRIRNDFEEEKKSSTVTHETEPMLSRTDSDQSGELNDGYHGDDWWWSRKVQRDAVSHSESYPYLLVTIGTGVSILRVDGPRKHVRVSGSTIGGGTYWGLIRLLTNANDFQDVLTLAAKGDPTKVDMMVGDIYGKNRDALVELGLPSNLVASSFGKLVAKQNPASGLKQEDLARALLLMVTNNIGQVAYLNAKLHETPRIYFVGNFLRHNKISQRRLAYAINYWSKGEMEALFLEHEGYFGALGAFLLSQGISHSAETGFVQADKAANDQGGGKWPPRPEKLRTRCDSF